MVIDRDDRTSSTDEPIGQVTPSGGRCRVRLWFGDHSIADYTAAPDLAVRYAAAIQRRFFGLRVTIDQSDDDGSRPLPAERWWEMVPR